MELEKEGYGFYNCRMLIDTQDYKLGEFFDYIGVPIALYLFKGNDLVEDFTLDGEHL